MFGSRITLSKRSKDEGEKPFWISYADLMTALMMLFLVVMSVSLIAVTKKISETERRKIERENAIQTLLQQIEKASLSFDGVKIDKNNYRIDFGDRARFDSGNHRLSADAARLLRAYVPKILETSESALGKKWLKRVVVEGFTDSDGTYLFNLELSLKRAKRVVCVLFDAPFADEAALGMEQKKLIRDLFMVGGFSFNASKQTKQESRRVELRLEFLSVDDLPQHQAGAESKDFGKCLLN